MRFETLGNGAGSEPVPAVTFASRQDQLTGFKEMGSAGWRCGRETCMQPCVHIYLAQCVCDSHFSSGQFPHFEVLRRLSCLGVLHGFLAGDQVVGLRTERSEHHALLWDAAQLQTNTGAKHHQICQQCVATILCHPTA
eukprot:1160675-Pelagomonas_calceolata.AAC.1